MLNELIESMLLLARLDHEEDQPREPMLLDRTAATVLERQRRRDSDRAYRLEVHTTETLVEAQPTWLERVIANLVGNASKYSRPGGDVSVVNGRGDGHVDLRVLDEGPGLDEEDLRQSSSRSTARQARRIGHPGPGWAWPSASASSSRSGAGSGPIHCPPGGASSVSRCPWSQTMVP